MAVTIAIPEPTSTDTEYNQRSLPLYVAAVESAGGRAVVIPLTERRDGVAKMIEEADGILLPGSGYDVDPRRYGEDRIAECGEADPGRAEMDDLLLQSAFDQQKPILGICHGAQTLNVWRNGSLVQDIQTGVNHRPGRQVVDAHPARIAEGSRLSTLLSAGEHAEASVNSSHHQAIKAPGDNLLITAVSPEDGVVEAVELDSGDHFVLGVQWHPERTYAQQPLSRAIFAAFVGAAEDWQERKAAETTFRA